MEFKFRAIDNFNPSTMQRSLPTVTYLPDRSLPMDGGFSGSRVPLATNEAALRREMEKAQIRRDILRRMELEEEVRRELAMEGAFGTTQRPLNSTPMMMNPVAVDDHIGASKPALILAPPEIKHSSQTSDKDKVILLAKPDPDLYGAKRKAVTHDVLDDEPSAIGLNKKLKKEWSCDLCQIKASSENGLNDHLKGKKHKAREARQKRKIMADAVVNTTISRVDENGVDAESKNEEQHVETMAGNGLNVTESKTEEKLVDTMVGKSVVESKNEEQLVEMVGDNGVSVTESKTEENEDQLAEMVADNGVSVTESKNETFEEMMVDKRVLESKHEEQYMEKNENVDSFESKKGAAATEEAGKKNALTETMNVGGLWCELCQIGTTSQVVMEGHKKGKKHIKKMKMFNQKTLSSTSIVS